MHTIFFFRGKGLLLPVPPHPRVDKRGCCLPQGPANGATCSSVSGAWLDRQPPKTYEPHKALRHNSWPLLRAGPSPPPKAAAAAAVGASRERLGEPLVPHGAGLPRSPLFRREGRGRGAPSRPRMQTVTKGRSFSAAATPAIGQGGRAPKSGRGKQSGLPEKPSLVLTSAEGGQQHQGQGDKEGESRHGAARPAQLRVSRPRLPGNFCGAAPFPTPEGRDLL